MLSENTSQLNRYQNGFHKKNNNNKKVATKRFFIKKVKSLVAFSGLADCYKCSSCPVNVALSNGWFQVIGAHLLKKKIAIFLLNNMFYKCSLRSVFLYKNS